MSKAKAIELAEIIANTFKQRLQESPKQTQERQGRKMVMDRIRVFTEKATRSLQQEEVVFSPGDSISLHFELDEYCFDDEGNVILDALNVLGEISVNTSQFQADVLGSALPSVEVAEDE